MAERSGALAAVAAGRLALAAMVASARGALGWPTLSVGVDHEPLNRLAPAAHHAARKLARLLPLQGRRRPAAR